MEIHPLKNIADDRRITSLESPSLAIIIHIVDGEYCHIHSSGFLILHYMSAWNRRTYLYGEYNILCF
jgi:hypothetical protein